MAGSVRQADSDLATCSITVNGSAIAGDDLILAAEVEHEVNRIPTARIVLNDGSLVDSDFPLAAQSTFAPGGDIELRLGYHAKDKPVFKGLILRQQISLARDGTSQLTLVCRDAAIKTTLARSSVQFHEASDSDVMTTLLRNAGLSAEVGATAIKREHQVKNGASDWDFILSRAEANGQIVLVRDGKVRIAKPSFTASGLTAEYGDTIEMMEIELDATSQLTGVISRAWDPKSQTVVSGEAGEPSVNRQGDLDGAKLARVLGLPHYRLQSQSPLSAEELTVWADAQLVKSRLSRIRGMARFSGNAGIEPGQLIDLAGLGKRFNGSGYVARVRHVLAGGEWTTEVGFGLPQDWFTDRQRDIGVPAAAGLRPGVGGLQIGKVLKVDGDPQGERRIKVAMPLHDDGQQGIWVRLGSPYATANAGIAFLPEVGDEVILGFLNEDPDAGIVLGALQSSARPAPVVPDEKNTIKTITTNSHLKISFDDEKKVLTFETPGGHSVTLDDDRKSITLKDLNGNTIVMSESGLAMTSPKDISIKADGSVSIKGTGGVTVDSPADVSLKGANIVAEGEMAGTFKGGATVELSAGGTTTVKGAMVMIN